MHASTPMKLPKMASQPKLAPPVTALDTVIDPGHRKLPSLSSPPRSSRHSVHYSGSPLSATPRSPPPSPSSVGTTATFLESVSLLQLSHRGGERERDAATESPDHFDRMVDSEVRLRLVQHEILSLQAQVKQLKRRAESPLPAPPGRWASVPPCKVIVDLAILQRNAETMRRFVPGHVKICAILKNNAFGHGIGQVAKTISPYVDVIGFVDNWEAHECRRNDVILPMLRVRPASAEEVADAPVGAQEIVASFESAVIYSCAARSSHKTVDVHLMVNVGENRMSFNLPQDMDSLLASCALPNVNVVGIMAHFACADDSELTLSQLGAFTAAADAVEGELAKKLGREVHLVRHCANTQATVSLPETHLDMVRVGGGLFGQEDNVIPLGLRPAFTWKTSVVLVRKVPAGTAIGYGMAHQFARDSFVATIPIGYGHGFHKRLGSSSDSWAAHAEVVVNGVRCPVVGRVSSSMANIDVTHVPEVSGSLVRIGDEVLLMGLGEGDSAVGRTIDAAPSAEDLARWLGTSFDDLTSAVKTSCIEFRLTAAPEY